jgi:FMN phosphatase YigB (HAD superfamily)
LKERVTLSNEVGVMKPDEKIFRAAIDKISKGLSYQNVIFIAENKQHTAAARKLGMMTSRLEKQTERSTDYLI